MKAVKKMDPGPLPRMRSGELAPNVVPGMYPVVYFAADLDGVRRNPDPICYRCARTARERGEIVTDYVVHWEGAPIECAHCGRDVESAYGDPQVPAC